jgi:hypothetical protein
MSHPNRRLTGRSEAVQTLASPWDGLGLPMSDNEVQQSMAKEVSEQNRDVAPLPTPSVAFRMTADFVVEIPTAAEFLQRPDISPEERRLLLTILTTPEALNRVCRLAIVDDLAQDNAGLFEGQFSGAYNEEILRTVMPYLSSEDKEFWTKLQHRDVAVNPLTEMFCEFKTALRRVVVEDVSTGEVIPLKRNAHS